MLGPKDFQTLFDLSPNPYMLVDRELRYVAANRAYLETTASTLEGLLGRHILEAFPNDPDDPGNASAVMLRESFERVLATRRRDYLALIPYRVPRLTDAGPVDEERFWSATHTPLLDADGEVSFILQHTVDVTEIERLKRKAGQPQVGSDAFGESQMQAAVLARAREVQQANTTLDAERRHLRRLFEQAPGFICYLQGPAHVFEIANRAYLELIGRTDILGKRLIEALPELEGQEFPELLDRVFRTGEPYLAHGAVVELVRTPNGAPEKRLLDFIYQPVTDASGRVTGIFVQGQDVTERWRAEEELRRYREHLEELVKERTAKLEESQAALRQALKMEAVGNLTGGVAHDFNNLLQVIAGNLQLLQQDLPATDQVQRRLQTAVGAVSRGAKLAAQLLAFARKQPLEPVAIHLGRVARGMDELLRRTLGEQIVLETRVAPDLWNTFADRNQLENVILNLAINARDAMGASGTLTVEVSNATLDAAAVREHRDVKPGPYVMLAISDTGSGMSPEVLERVFEPFFTTKPVGRGTGLGLSMVYGFVTQSGGHVKIESAPGEGTTVRIFLPRTVEAEVSATEDAPGPIVGGTETVLVVEDDPEVRATAVELLVDLGYRVLKAAEAQAALAIVQSGVPIDLLFTDVVMPGPLKSPELARQAKLLLPGLRVLFTSGYSEDAIIHGGRLDPGVSLLSKPYRREELARKLRQLLGPSTSPRTVRSEPGTAPPLPPRKAGLEAPLRILFVEDDPDIRGTVIDLLTDLGHEVTAVSNAEEARNQLARSRFELLFTDLGLPGISGDQLAREAVRADGTLRVIIASGQGKAMPVYGEGLEHAVLLPKPFDIASMERALRQIRPAK